MPFKMNNTDGELREDRGSDSKGKRKSSSLEGKRWTQPQLALKLRFLALEGANFWFPLILDKDWIEDHLGLAKLHVVMDVDLSRFITIVSERPSQLWASSGASWKDVCQCVGFSWAADWQSHFVVQGTDSKFNKITWINFHPNPTSCPLNVLSHVQPHLHCMLWRCKLSSIGCLNDELSDDDAEQADDDEDATEDATEEATEASNPVTPGDVDEDCSMLELAVPGEAVEPLPNSDVADPAEPPQVLNVTEIVKRGHVTHTEAKNVSAVWIRRWPCGNLNTARFWQNSRQQWPPPWTNWWNC